MSPMQYEINPVDHITTDAIGEPGHRIFYLQASQNERNIILLVEKAQIQTLAIGLEQFLAEIMQQYPDLPEASSEYDEEKMHIRGPIDPLFRIGEFGLGYEVESDVIILVARAAVEEGQQPENVDEAQFWCTRSQIRAMCHWGIELAARGRPICPQCGEPMEPEGHLCPKKNGHKH